MRWVWGLRFDDVPRDSCVAIPVLPGMCLHVEVHLYEQQDSFPCVLGRWCRCVYGLCYPPSQWTGEDCGCNSWWLMFLLNGSVVALSRLSADTMTRQSGWQLDWQTHTHTGTYISTGPQQAFPDHHYHEAGPWNSWDSICSGPQGGGLSTGQRNWWIKNLFLLVSLMCSWGFECLNFLSMERWIERS